MKHFYSLNLWTFAMNMNITILYIMHVSTKPDYSTTFCNTSSPQVTWFHGQILQWPFPYGQLPQRKLANIPASECSKASTIVLWKWRCMDGALCLCMDKLSTGKTSGTRRIFLDIATTQDNTCWLQDALLPFLHVATSLAITITVYRLRQPQSMEGRASVCILQWGHSHGKLY